MTIDHHPEPIDIEGAIAKKAKAEPKKSTSVLLPTDLKAMKNGELVARIRVWLDNIDIMEVIRRSLEEQLEAVKRHIAAKAGNSKEASAIWVGHRPIHFEATLPGAGMRASDGLEAMKEYKKTITLPQSMWHELVDAATDMGTTFGEIVRIAVTHSYLVKRDDGTYFSTSEFGNLFIKGPEKSEVNQNLNRRRKEFSRRVKACEEAEK